MIRLLAIALFLFTIQTETVVGQEMNRAILERLIIQISDTAQVNGNTIRFMYKETMMYSVHDENANRMRIISPIIEKYRLGEEELLNALVANFHTALDVKYALSDEIIWSVFIHPLKELSEDQVLDAIEQVHAAHISFGTTYSSTGLVFPGNTKKKDIETTKKPIEKHKF